jgi:hypothetical protein
MMETITQPTAAGSLSQKTTPTVALLDSIFEAAFDKACSKEFPTRLAVLPEAYKQLKKEVHFMLGNIGEIDTLWGMTVIRIPTLKNQNALWELS